MNRFLNTLGKSNLAIAICQRCSFKMAHADMVRDPNTGLRMHAHCADAPDEDRRPEREPDRIALSFVLPDTYIGVSFTQEDTIPGGNPGGGGTNPTGDFNSDFNGDFSGGQGAGNPPPDPDEEPPPGGGTPGGSNGAGDFGNDYNSDFS